MKIVRICGGLGNQMFQYALAVALKEAKKTEEVYIDYSVMRGYPHHEGYLLDKIFNTDIPQAPISKIITVGWPLPYYRIWQIGSKILPVRKSMVLDRSGDAFRSDVFDNRDMLLDGYWQSPLYFDKYSSAIRKSFEFRNSDCNPRNIDFINKIKGKVSVSLHVRRGDYLSYSSITGVCSVDYYNKAIKLIKKMINPDLFVVFSDDQCWCRENLSDVLSACSIFVDWNRGIESYRDMQLMSYCSHNIIANSSFSWWGAWLNRNPTKIVIAPSQWMNYDGWKDILPDSWMKIGI